MQRFSWQHPRAALQATCGIFFGLGPVARVVAEAPYAGLGFIEAHGLAFILGILMWRAQPARGWHLAAAAIHVLLGTANLVFWQLFIVSDMLLVGYVTTALHGLFVVLQMSAAISARTALRFTPVRFHPAIDSGDAP